MAKFGCRVKVYLRADDGEMRFAINGEPAELLRKAEEMTLSTPLTLTEDIFVITDFCKTNGSIPPRHPYPNPD